MSDGEDKTPPKRGYGKPPVEHQFSKGVSGNPRGRPPKMVRALTPRQVRRDIFNFAEAPTRIRTAKGEKIVAVIEAVHMRLVQKALSGHGPSIRRVMELYERACKEHYETNKEVLAFVEMVEDGVMKQVEDPTREGEVFRNSVRKRTRRY